MLLFCDSLGKGEDLNTYSALAWVIQRNLTEKMDGEKLISTIQYKRELIKRSIDAGLRV